MTTIFLGRSTVLGLSFAGLSLLACSAPKPVLYPNAHLQEVGQEQAESDIEQCIQAAKSGGSTDKTGEVAKSTAGGAVVGAAAGTVGGAVLGHPERGAAVGAASGGTAGLLRGLFRTGRSDHTKQYERRVERCMKDRGYELTGWQ